MSKFNPGDRVVVVSSGWGFPDEEVGRIYTIEKYEPNIDRYKTVEPHADGTDRRRASAHTFALLQESSPEEQPQANPNVKLISTYVPSEYKWMAMDADGEWYCYASKPAKQISTWKNRSESTLISVGKCDPEDINIPWYNTLHKI